MEITIDTKCGGIEQAKKLLTEIEALNVEFNMVINIHIIEYQKEK